MKTEKLEEKKQKKKGKLVFIRLLL